MTRGSSDTIGDLRKEHEHLYTKLLDSRGGDKRTAESGEEQKEIAREVNTLLDKIETITPDVRLLHDYTWLINASLQWQAFGALLKIDRRIKIPEPPDGLWAPTQRLGKDDVDHWLASRERDICRLRHLKNFLWQVRNVQVEPQDEYSAKAYFAKDTLNGAMAVSEHDVSTSISGQAVDFVEKVPPSVYGYLEEVWFRDVVELDAYLIWEEAGAEEKRSPELRERDYFQAYERYKQLLANQAIKRGPEKFISIRDYLLGKHVGEDQRLYANARDHLIRKKWEHAGEKAEAEAYVEGFYNNIVSAIMQADREALKCIQQAILISERKRGRASVMNGFEAAICVYFLKGLEYFAEGRPGERIVLSEHHGPSGT